MKTLKDLTPEIEAKIPEYIASALEGVFDGGRYRAFDLAAAIAAVKWNYEFCGEKEPLVIVSENPLESQVILAHLQDMPAKSKLKLDSEHKVVNLSCKRVANYINSWLFTLNVYSDCYFTWYEFLRKEFTLPLSVEKDFQTCYALQKASGVYSALFLKDVCIVSKYPKRVWRDAALQLHHPSGPAVEWGHSYSETIWHCYYWRGTNVPKQWIENQDSIKQQDIMAESNAERRRCLMEILGAQKYYSILADGNELRLLDEDVDQQGNTMKLYAIQDSFLDGQMVQFLEVIDPSTGRTYNLYPPGQNAKNVWGAKAQTFSNETLYARQGDVGLTRQDYDGEYPVQES